MCGIAGIINSRKDFNYPVQIKKMTDVIAHRGPNDEGLFVWNNVALGHRRLSIIDLSDGGHQPMHFLEAGLSIVFNGEIYNFIELRKELAHLGHTFNSNSDTEVILKAYAQWGEACVNKFNGMWAFAILDQKRNQVFCSRDRFGVKPFYYIRLSNSSGIAFGSEIRQLLPLLPRVGVNASCLEDFLLTSVCDHSHQTFFAEVEKLPASHNLIFDLEKNQFSIQRYYTITQHTDLAKLSEREAIELYREKLTDAVKLRLRSDVAVGTCLSGGLDSSSVATLAASLQSNSRNQFYAITAISEQENNNEAGYAEQVVKASGLSWIKVCPSYQDFVDSLPAVVTAQEEPFGSPSLTMQYFVMKAARENNIPVLLDGQGGDETLLGYSKYYASYLLNTLRSQGIAAFINALKASDSNNSGMSFINSMKFLAGSLIAPARYAVYLSRHAYLKKIPRFPQHLSDFAKASWNDFALQNLEISSTNLPVLLRYEDKNSMAHSIETRLPFLDYRVLETALSLPNHFKIKEGWSKWILRKAMQGMMPDTIVWRKNKFGFEAPENLWLSQHISEMQDTVLQSALLENVVRKKTLSYLYPHLNLRTQWRLYSIALWEKTFGVSA